MLDASTILEGITLAVAGWTLKKVIDQGEVLATLKQKLRDLPCQQCGNVTVRQKQ
jgi:hypothetical protein